MPNQTDIPAGRLYAGETADERLTRQRRQFMDAGLAVFGSTGYRACTVRSLCREAGLIDRYFYKNFADKEDLLAEVYSESMDRIQAAVEEALMPVVASGDVARVLSVGLDAFFAAFEDRQVARVCWLEVLGVSPRIDALYTRRSEVFADMLLKYARLLAPTIRLQGDEELVAGIALVGAVNQSALHWLLSGYREPRNILVAINTRVLLGAANALGEKNDPA